MTQPSPQPTLLTLS
uniref:Uncharacterized protein n=1 Tax=Romanomermis culicivorax TaxID=13658 RepID=A0A915KXZ2_ROMCU